MSAEKSDLTLKLELELNRSPDLFTPDEEIDLVTPESNFKDDSSLENIRIDNIETNVEISTSENSIEGANSDQTSRLFDEMEKIDNNSGSLNLKSPQKSFFNPKNRISDVAMDVDDKISTEVTPDVKKKLTKKITDYLSKKPV